MRLDLIRVAGDYYRPEAQGYTRILVDAGRYTIPEAMVIMCPNGPDGSRDGMESVETTLAQTAAADQAELDRSAMEFASTMRSSDEEPGWRWWAEYAAGDPEAIAMAQSYGGILVDVPPCSETVVDDLARQIFALAQLGPGEGIEDATSRIGTLLSYDRAARTRALRMLDKKVQHLHAERDAERSARETAEKEAKQWQDAVHLSACEAHSGLQEEAKARADTAEAELERTRNALNVASVEREALILLLYTDEVFVGNHWEDYPNADKGTWPQLCAHVQSYGADAEEIPDDQIVPLADLVRRFGRGAIQGWVCFRRGTEKPQKGQLGEEGLAAYVALNGGEPAT